MGSKDAHLQMGNAAEVVGKVQSDLTVRAYQATDFGSNIGKRKDSNFVTWIENGR